MRKRRERIVRSVRGRTAQIYQWLQDQKAKQRLWQAPGHFYSPIPLPVDQLDESLFDRRDRRILGIDLRVDEQVELLNRLSTYYPETLPSHPQATAGRYFAANDQFASGDAAGYTMMLRHLRPTKVLEVGSGYSTALALDVRDEHTELSFGLQCIEPYPARLRRLLKEGDSIDLIEKRLEEIPLSQFSTLASGDILFIDSTHVAKLGSDVNYLYEQVLPSLASGVVIHVHDIQWPFEYPRAWAAEGRAWNEAYVLRAFLQFNDSFEIIFWANFLSAVRPEVFQGMSLFLEDVGSGIWVKRTG